MSSLISTLLSAYLKQPTGYGVYIHWPYCTQLCSYCNFNKYRQPPNVDYQKLQDCLIMELKHYLFTAKFPFVTSVYFGGGTPSLAPPSTVQAILNCIRSVGLVDEAEVTLEVNPRLEEKMKLKSFYEAGVNRLSMGIQSLNDHTLKVVMKRDHLTSHALDVLNEVCSLPVNVNADLIFGLPKQDLSEWIDQLSQICTYAIDHLSLYQLTLERGTPLAKDVEAGHIDLPHNSTVTDMYFNAIEFLHSKGFHQYEVSNFAMSGFESKHNLNYWLGGNYIGIGPGAHSRFQKPHSHNWISCINSLTPQQWINSVARNGSGVKALKVLSQKERFEEVLSTSFRTCYGLTRLQCDSFGMKYDSILKQIKLQYPLLIDEEFLQASSHSITPTIKGLSVLNTILPDLLFCIDKL